MDKIAERKHRHELKRAEKRALVHRQKAYAEGKIGPYGSRSRHHQQGNMPVEVVVTPAPDPTPKLTKEEAMAIHTETVPSDGK